MSEISERVRELRIDYQKGELNESSVNADPIAQFQHWMQEAISAEVPEPNALSLATVNAAGQPSVRIVLLRGLDERGFVFFTNYESHKGTDLAANPHAAMAFFWPELERQVRIMGTVEKVSKEESDGYFQSRPRSSRIGAWASPQSQVIDGRSFLELRVDELETQFGSGQVIRPEHWGGYRLNPTSVEFWQGRKSRLHDRIQYVEGEEGWKVQRLAP